MPLQATSGAASYDAFGGGVPVVPNYIEDVFQTWLYSGNSSTQTITNGIDLSTKGGMVWTKSRNATYDNTVYDTARGTGNNKALYTNTTNAQGAFTGYQDLTAYNTDGYSIGSPILLNETGKNYVSWTFRKQPKFFDVVTYTGDGTSNRAVAHNLGSVPGFMIVKVTSESNNWTCWHRSITGKILELNTTAAQANDSGGGYFYSSPDATNIYLGSDWQVNKTDATYVAYLFAHNAGGFGLTGTDNVISCGSFTTSGGGGDATVDLGYEPQWLLVKSASGTSGWDLIDNMRGMPNLGGYGTAVGLEANNSNAEGSRNPNCFPTATGFYYARAASTTYIYIAIRRGPMKVPTSGTSVFSQTLTSSNANPLTITTNFPVDMTINRYTGESSNYVFDRLRGANASAAGGTATYLKTEATSAEAVIGTIGDNMQSNTTLIDRSLLAGTSDPKIYYSFRRAPSFFDEVCYKGNGSTQTITHNLGVVPELIIGKNRTTTGNNWPVLFNFASTTMNYGFLNLTNSCPNDTYANVGVFSAAPTSTSMFLVNSGSMNTNTNQHIAYLFATCAGVSKVFSYTGNGSSQTINCGFTGGARFVLIKRTDSTGDWYVWDSARGIVSGNDPHLSLNTTAAEVTTDDTIDTDSTGFVVNQVSATDVNVSSATYIGLAIA